ncbi:MAG: hypothetical protein WBL27_05540 [Salinimicrobium sp.]
MRQLNPFFLIGTLGMLFTAMFHVLMAAILTEEKVGGSFSFLYPVFIGFLILGTAVMIKRKRGVKNS